MTRCSIFFKTRGFTKRPDRLSADTCKCAIIGFERKGKLSLAIALLVRSRGSEFGLYGCRKRGADSEAGSTIV